MPSSTCSLFGGPSSAPSCTTQTLLAEASVRKPSRNMIVSIAPWSADICRASTLPSSEMLLMSPRSQRKSRAVTQATPWWRCSAVGGFIGAGHHEDGRRRCRRASRGRAARRRASPGCRRAGRARRSPSAPRRACGSARATRSGLSGFGMRSLARLRSSRAMCSSKRNSRPAVDRHDLVDAVAEDEAAVEHRDLGLAQRAVLAVQVAQGVGMVVCMAAPSSRQGLRLTEGPVT